MGFVDALLPAAVADAFGWTVVIAPGAAFARAGVVLIVLVRADRRMAQSDCARAPVDAASWIAAPVATACGDSGADISFHPE